jgi:tRNA-dihydrouridine synthase B
MQQLYEFYGEHTGMCVARKHISWYTRGLVGSAHFRHAMNQLQTRAEQIDATDSFFEELRRDNDRLRYEATSIQDMEMLAA